MRVVVLSGKMHSGKSTVAQMLVDEYGFDRISFAAALKREVRLLGFDQVHVDTKPDWMRSLLIALGMARRALDPQHWVKIVHRDMDTLVANGHKNFVCDDCRFENEVAYFQSLPKKYNVTFIRIERQYDEEPTAAVLKDKTETALDRWDGFDHIITAVSGDVPGLLEKARQVLFAPNTFIPSVIQDGASPDPGEDIDDTPDDEGPQFGDND